MTSTTMPCATSAALLARPRSASTGGLGLEVALEHRPGLRSATPAPRPSVVAHRDAPVHVPGTGAAFGGAVGARTWGPPV